jgi:hypothetical protein
MLAGLVLAGLTTVVTETVRSGGHTIKVERLRITDAGRRALEADRACTYRPITSARSISTLVRPREEAARITSALR